VHVKTSTVPPQMFRENIGVVVEGTMVRGGYFQSSRLMVSHNNEYKAPAKGHPVDEKQLRKMIESTEGLEGN
jgi:cytochrome c-type biogenesis protein CcmE